MSQSLWNVRTGIKANRLCSTLDLKEDEWLQIRRSGIGGSDIAALCGVNPFSSNVDVYLDKMGLLPKKENDKMRFGKLLEPVIADEYSRRNNANVERCNAILQNPSVPYFLSNLDRVIISQDDSPSGILECKATAWAKAWDDETIPDMYYCQGQWYMGTTGLPYLDFAVLISGNVYYQPKRVAFDPDAFSNLCKVADRFWNENVLAKNPPVPNQGCKNSDSLQILFPSCDESQRIQLDPKLDALIDQRLRLSDIEAQAKSQSAAIEAQILFALKDAKYGETPKWKVTRVLFERDSFNAKSFSESHPDLFNKFKKSSTVSYPRFTRKAENKNGNS